MTEFWSESHLARFGLGHEDIPLLKQLIHGAYVIFTSWEVNHKCDYKRVRSIVSPERIDLPGISLFNRYFEKYCKDDPEEVPKVFDNEFFDFLDLDPLFPKNMDVYYSMNEPMSFDYVALSYLTGKELVELKDLIDRIQILISSGCRYVDFRVAFKFLSDCPRYNFTNYRSEFDFTKSRQNQLRFQKLLAMYMATTKKSFFRSAEEYYKFLKQVYQWLLHKTELINSILHPSRTMLDDSRFYVSLSLLRDLPDTDKEMFFSKVIPYFRLHLTMSQPHYTCELEGYQDHLFKMFMEQYQKLELQVMFKNFVLYLRIRKIFLDFLLGNRLQSDRCGTIRKTKAAYYLLRLYYSHLRKEMSEPFSQSVTGLPRLYFQAPIRLLWQSFERKRLRVTFRTDFNSIKEVSEILPNRAALPAEETVLFPFPTLTMIFEHLVYDRQLFKTTEDQKLHSTWVEHCKAGTAVLWARAANWSVEEEEQDLLSDKIA